MQSSIKDIVIVGGGTAGWLSACYLRRALPESVKITVIESPNIASIGVGEATVPTLVSTIKFIGLEEEDWMNEVGATIKLGIRFDGFRTGAKDDRYHHPFTNRSPMNLNPLKRPHFPIIGEGFPYASYWMHEAANGRAPNFAEAVSPLPSLCDANRFSMAAGQEHRLTYAYQLDAVLFAKKLTRHGVEQGISHISANVIDTTLDERGHIVSVSTDKDEIYAGDFFIDCTGFRGVLISKAMNEPFLSANKYLLNDTAIALSADLIDDKDEEGDRPFTVSAAMNAGWSWRIPLQHRFGTGYVFSSAHITPEEAERELRQALGTRGDDYEARVIRMRVGRRERFWVKNCVAIGLSGSFIEPLESTSIFFTEFQLANLLNHFPGKELNPPLVKEYNRKLIHFYEQIRDFIALHFGTTEREDTSYWRAIKNEVPLPPGALNILERFENGMIPVEDSEELRIFHLQGVMSVLSGMGLRPKVAPQIPGLLEDLSADFLKRVADQTTMLMANVPIYDARNQH